MVSATIDQQDVLEFMNPEIKDGPEDLAASFQVHTQPRQFTDGSVMLPLQQDLLQTVSGAQLQK